MVIFRQKIKSVQNVNRLPYDKNVSWVYSLEYAFMQALNSIAFRRFFWGNLWQSEQY